MKSELYPFSAEDTAEIKRFERESRAMACVPEVIRAVELKFQQSTLPREMFVKKVLWLPTNLWLLGNACIRDENLFRMDAALQWRNARGEVSTNPLGKPGTLPGFGPGFKLPCIWPISVPLTATPTDGKGWVTGFAPGIPEEYRQKVLSAIVDGVSKLPWFDIQSE